MPQLDLPLDELRAYAPPREEPPDFDAFWADTLADARARRPATHFEQGRNLANVATLMRLGSCDGSSRAEAAVCQA
ncbi:MAG: acetylxylan esterase [Candidatus Limnocylindrales bacterium]